MASSGYTAITFIANEQPTTAKWNLIGSNDASFNNGNGFEDNILVARHFSDASIAGTRIIDLPLRYQTDNNNTIASNTSGKNVTIQAGWAANTGSAASSMSIPVTFPTAFTTILGVVTQLNAVKATTAPSTIKDLNANYNTTAETFSVSAGTISETGFTANLARNSATFSAGTYYGFSWLAWGIL